MARVKGAARARPGSGASRSLEHADRGDADADDDHEKQRERCEPSPPGPSVRDSTDSDRTDRVAEQTEGGHADKGERDAGGEIDHDARE